MTPLIPEPYQLPPLPSFSSLENEVLNSLFLKLNFESNSFNNNCNSTNAINLSSGDNINFNIIQNNQNKSQYLSSESPDANLPFVSPISDFLQALSIKFKYLFSKHNKKNTKTDTKKNKKKNIKNSSNVKSNNSSYSNHSNSKLSLIEQKTHDIRYQLVDNNSKENNNIEKTNVSNNINNNSNNNNKKGDFIESYCKYNALTAALCGLDTPNYGAATDSLLYLSQAANNYKTNSDSSFPKYPYDE